MPAWAISHPPMSVGMVTAPLLKHADAVCKGAQEQFFLFSGPDSINHFGAPFPTVVTICAQQGDSKPRGVLTLCFIWSHFGHYDTQHFHGFLESAMQRYSFNHAAHIRIYSFIFQISWSLCVLHPVIPCHSRQLKFPDSTAPLL